MTGVEFFPPKMKRKEEERHDPQAVEKRRFSKAVSFAGCH
jgi:hypothetical protein